MISAKEAMLSDLCVRVFECVSECVLVSPKGHNSADRSQMQPSSSSDFSSGQAS